MENNKRSNDDAGELSGIKKTRLENVEDNDVDSPNIDNDDILSLNIEDNDVDFPDIDNNDVISKNIDSSEEVLQNIDNKDKVSISVVNTDVVSIKVDIKVDFVSICSSIHGKHVLPKVIGLRFPQSGFQEAKTFFLDPKEFIPKSLDAEFIKKELRRFGYNDDLTVWTLHESFLQENLSMSERLELVTKTEVVLTALAETIKELKAKVILNFVDKRSKQFLLSLFRQKNLKSTIAQILIENVEKITIEGEVCEPLTLEVSDDDEADLVQVFVDAVFVTYENEEMLRYTQLAYLGAFCQLHEESLFHDSEIIPTILETGDRGIKSQSRKKLAETLSAWRKTGSANVIGEKEALTKFCSFLADCCSCRSDSSNLCNVNFVSFEDQTIVPVILSKMMEFNLEDDFFRHISKHATYQKLAKELPSHEMSKFSETNFRQVSSICQTMKSVSDKKPDLLKQLANPVSDLKIHETDLKSSSDILANIFVGDSVDCDVTQSSRPSWRSNLCLTFGTDDETTSCHDIWAKKKSVSSFKIFLLKNLSNFSLAEIRPEPNGHWTFTKYSVSDGNEITNGVSNVFNGKFLILNRKNGFNFPGQVLGVCQFVRPSIGKSQCAAACQKEFRLLSDSDIFLAPKSTSIVSLKIAKTDSDSFKKCLDSNHILRASKISISILAVIDGYSDANLTMNFVVRNVGDDDVVRISNEKQFLTVTCCFNEKEFPGLLSRSSGKSSFNWEKETRYKQLPSNRVVKCNQENHVVKKYDVSSQNNLENKTVVNRQTDPHKVVSSSASKEASNSVSEMTTNRVSDSNGNDPGVKVCLVCSDVRHLEKCPNCPEMDVKLTDIQDKHGICVARILFPEDFKGKNGDKKIGLVKFFSQDCSVMCPFIAEVVQNEYLLVFYINISAAEQSLTNETIGTVQIVEPTIAPQTSVKCRRKRILVAGCDAKIPPKKMREIETSWGLNPRDCSDSGHFQTAVAFPDIRISCPMQFIPFFDLASVPMINNSNAVITITRGQALMTTECVSTADTVEAIINQRLQIASKEEEKVEKLYLDTKDNVLYAKGYLYPMSPSLLSRKDDADSDDEIVEIEVSFNKDCKKSCLSRGFEWSTFCTRCPQYMFLTISPHLLPTDGSFVTVLCRVVGPLIDDVEECPKCIALFPSTTSSAIFQVVPSVREVLLYGNDAFAFVTISTRSRCVLDNRELVSGTLLGFGQKRTKEESLVGDGQCLWPLKLELESPDSPPLIVEEGRSLKVRASFSVPESHKFDPVSVEFGLAFMNVGNEDQSFLLQGKKELVLTFVNKGPKLQPEEEAVQPKTVELKHGCVLGNIRLLTDPSSVQMLVSNHYSLPKRPVRFVDTSGRTSCLRPVVSTQNVSVLKNSSANVVCRILNDESSSRWDDAFRHVFLLSPDDSDSPWSFKSRLISADSAENADKFYIQLQNNLKGTNHLRLDDPISNAKIYVGLESDARYEIFEVVGRIPVPVSPGGLFTLRCELVRWSGFSGKKFRIKSGIVELVALFDFYFTKDIDLMSEAVIFKTMIERGRREVVYFEVMARNDSDKTVKPQFIEIGLARGLTIN